MTVKQQQSECERKHLSHNWDERRSNDEKLEQLGRGGTSCQWFVCFRNRFSTREKKTRC